MRNSESFRNVKLSQARLCSAALQREAGEINSDELILYAMQYASAVAEWRAAVQREIEKMPDIREDMNGAVL